MKPGSSPSSSAGTRSPSTWAAPAASPAPANASPSAPSGPPAPSPTAPPPTPGPSSTTSTRSTPTAATAAPTSTSSPPSVGTATTSPITPTGTSTSSPTAPPSPAPPTAPNGADGPTGNDQPSRHRRPPPTPAPRTAGRHPLHPRRLTEAGRRAPARTPASRYSARVGAAPCWLPSPGGGPWSRFVVTARSALARRAGKPRSPARRARPLSLPSVRPARRPGRHHRAPETSPPPVVALDRPG